MMRKSLLLLLCLLLAALPALGEGAVWSIDAPEAVIRPGKAVLLSFNAPEADAVDILLTDGEGNTITIVAEDYAAQAGRNELWWNGTYGGVFAPAGSYELTVRTEESSASAAVTVGTAAPYITNILSSVGIGTGEMSVDFYASVDGLLTVGLWNGGVWTPVDSLEIDAGENVFTWDMTGADPAANALTLTLTDMTGFPSNEEHIPLTAEDFALAIPATEAPTEAPTEEIHQEIPVEEPAMEETAAPEVTLEIPQSIATPEPTEVPTEKPTPEPTPVIYTPAHGSPYEGQDTSLNYWTLPMDITDEAAVWEMITKPITVVDGDSRAQVVIREEPDEDSRGVGVVTCASQGVHVLETLDNGWSLIECYSSSFHDSAVKAWNMLVQGYIKTDKLKVVEPELDYGLVVDKLTQRMYMFKDGKLFTTLLISTGVANERQPYNETRSGEFLIISPTGGFWSDNMFCPRALKFNDGDLLHEVPYVQRSEGSSKIYSATEPYLGQKASHGCIRVQRKKTPEGVNMAWIWNNRQMRTKLIVWEDWQGRQIEYPADDLLLYYNPNGGEFYHSQETCYSYQSKKKTMTAFTYAELEDEEHSKLKRCEYCAPVERVSVIDEINARYAEGGDHDPIMTEARQKYLNGEYD